MSPNLYVPRNDRPDCYYLERLVKVWKRGLPLEMVEDSEEADNQVVEIGH